MDKLVVHGTEINVQWDLKRDDFLSLTDITNQYLRQFRTNLIILIRWTMDT